MKNGKARSSIAVEAREEHGGEHRKKIEVLFKDLLQEFGICYCEKRQKKRSVRDKFCAKTRAGKKEKWPINKRNTPIIMTVVDIFKLLSLFLLPEELEKRFLNYATRVLQEYCILILTAHTMAKQNWGMFQTDSK